MTAAIKGFKLLASDACFVALTLTRFTVETLIEALGIVLASVLLATGGDGEAFFSQLENLSRHYLAGTADARASFDLGAIGVYLVTVAVLLLVRLPEMIAYVRDGLAEGRDHD